MEAQLKRKVELQQFIAVLVGKIAEAGYQRDDSASFFLRVLSWVIDDVLIARGDRAFEPRTQDEQEACACYMPLADDIRVFARTDEEAAVIRCELFETVMRMGFIGDRQAYAKQQLLEPKKIFNGRGPMEEVPLKKTFFKGL